MPYFYDSISKFYLIERELTLGETCMSYTDVAPPVSLPCTIRCWDEAKQEWYYQEHPEIGSQYSIDDVLTYVDLRVREYPPVLNYVDGLVKGDIEQVNAYFVACRTVKEKYPKNMQPITRREFYQQQYGLRTLP